MNTKKLLPLLAIGGLAFLFLGKTSDSEGLEAGGTRVIVIPSLNPDVSVKKSSGGEQGSIIYNFPAPDFSMIEMPQDFYEGDTKKVTTTMTFPKQEGKPYIESYRSETVQEPIAKKIMVTTMRTGLMSDAFRGLFQRGWT